MIVTKEIRVHCLLCHQHVKFATFCLESLIRFSQDPITLVIHDDGSLTETDCHQLKQTLGNRTRFIVRKTADEEMNEYLTRFPHASAYRYQQPYGLKLLDIPYYTEGDAIAYCDSDILFFKPFRGLYDGLGSTTRGRFMIDAQERHLTPALSVTPWGLLQEKQIRLPKSANSGIILYRKSAYDLEFIDWFLGNPEAWKIYNWVEQTCWFAMSTPDHTEIVDPNQIRIAQANMTPRDDLIAAHFVSSKRNLLNGYIHASERYYQNTAVQVKTIPCQELSAYGLFWGRTRSRFFRRLDRIWPQPTESW